MTNQLYETLRHTATKHIQAFNSPNPFDPDDIYRHRDPKCIMRFHPSNTMPDPFGNNAQISRTGHEPVLRMLGALMSKMEFHIDEMIVDVTTKTVVSRLRGIYDFKAVGGEPEEKGYMIEYVWITAHNDSGERIVGMEECRAAPRVVHMITKAQMYAKKNG